MRQFQHYKLFATQQVADAARKILETSGMEKFCRSLDAPDEPPLLTANRIEFASKELALLGRGRWDFCIVDEATYQDHLARRREANRRGEAYDSDAVDEETGICWGTYGDTNADGIKMEVWALLIWCRFNLSPNGLENCYIKKYTDLWELAPFYEEVFGVVLDGTVLDNLRNVWYGVETSMRRAEELGLNLSSKDDLELYSTSEAAHRVPDAISQLITAAGQAMFYCEMPRAKTVVNLFEEHGEHLEPHDFLCILTFGMVEYDDYAEYYPGTSLLLDTAAERLVEVTEKYAKLWHVINSDVNAEDIEESRTTSKKWMGMRPKNDPHRPTSDETKARHEREEQREKTWKNRVEGIAFSEYVEKFIMDAGYDSTVEAIISGVPIEDILA